MSTDALRIAFAEVSTLNQPYICCESDASHLNCFDTNCTQPREATSKPIDYNKYRPYFLHVPIEKIKKTFDSTTQFATNVMSGHNILQTIQSPYPAHNVWRRNEPVASDTIFAEVPAIDSGGQTMAQLYIGRKSLVIDVFGMSTEKEFVNSLEDVI